MNFPRTRATELTEEIMKAVRDNYKSPNSHFSQVSTSEYNSTYTAIFTILSKEPKLNEPLSEKSIAILDEAIDKIATKNFIDSITHVIKYLIKDLTDDSYLHRDYITWVELTDMQVDPNKGVDVETIRLFNSEIEAWTYINLNKLIDCTVVSIYKPKYKE